MNIYQALSAVMAEVREVRKGDRNSAQGFNFRGIDAVVNAVGPALRKHGVIISPTVIDHQYGTVTVGRNATQMGHVIVKVAYTFHGPDGDSITTVVLGEAMDAGDKAVPKAMSVAFRTALLQALTLPTDDLDPDAQSYERASRHPSGVDMSPPVKPAADDGDLDKWVSALQSARTLDAVNDVALTVSGYSLTDEQLAVVKAAGTAARARLEGE